MRARPFDGPQFWSEFQADRIIPQLFVSFYLTIINRHYVLLWERKIGRVMDQSEASSRTREYRRRVASGTEHTNWIVLCVVHAGGTEFNGRLRRHATEQERNISLVRRYPCGSNLESSALVNSIPCFVASKKKIIREFANLIARSSAYLWCSFCVFAFGGFLIYRINIKLDRVYLALFSEKINTWN